MKYSDKSISSEAFDELFEALVNEDSQALSRYDEKFYQYFAINDSRSKRVKKRMIKEEWSSRFPDLSEYTLVAISEPWCGDSAFSFPILQWLGKEKGANFQVVLRDEHPEVIDNHLTNGGRAIPKLVVIKNDEVIGEWGPRPAELQDLRSQWVSEGKEAEEIHLLLQKWYNQDKGESVVRELSELFGS